MEKLCKGSHKNIIHIYNHGRLTPSSAFYFIDMELCDFNLDEYIRCSRQAPGLKLWKREETVDAGMLLIWPIMDQILDGLTFIHRNNEVHRDLTPQNGMIMARISERLMIVLYAAQDRLWKIADFGLTMRGTRTANLHQTQGGRGKPGYRAPELLRDEGSAFNKQVDIWAVGCILYELCTGQKLFKSDLDGYEFALLRKTGTHDLAPIYPAESTDEMMQILLPLLEYDYRCRPATITVQKSLFRVYHKSLLKGTEASEAIGIHRNRHSI